MLPRLPTAVAIKAALVLFWSRLGSLNALEGVARARFWSRWLKGPLCSVAIQHGYG